MKKLPFSRISIIYNPNSTGLAVEKAEKLHDELKSKLAGVPLSLRPTDRAGHGEELAYDITKQAKNPLIISVSGDGGYNEVINGALRAAEELGAKPICAVHNAGNANDHHRTLQENPLIEAITDGKTQDIDLLKLDVVGSKASLTRYAHSYIGLGLTPAIADELNQQQLNRWRETLLVWKTFWRYTPITLEVEGERRQFDSLVFANINQMAKVLTLSKDGHPTDGKFEVIEMPHIRKIRLFIVAIRAALRDLGAQPRRKKYQFGVVEDVPLQLDGEVLQLHSGDTVTVHIAPQILRTVL